MRATRAYIASFGTTGLLLAFSASLLVVVGTLFAFNAWPGADIRDAVGSLIVDEKEERFGVAGPAQVAIDSAPAALAVASLPAGTSLPAGGATAPGFAGGQSLPDGSPGERPDGSLVDGTVRGGGGGDGVVTPTDDQPIDTGGGTDQAADATEGVTRGLGDAVGGVSPELGNTVTESGQALSDIVRDLPDVRVGRGGVTVGG